MQVGSGIFGDHRRVAVRVLENQMEVTVRLQAIAQEDRLQRVRGLLGIGEPVTMAVLGAALLVRWSCEHPRIGNRDRCWCAVDEGPIRITKNFYRPAFFARVGHPRVFLWEDSEVESPSHPPCGGTGAYRDAKFTLGGAQ
jgi:hypothetical protein